MSEFEEFDKQVIELLDEEGVAYQFELIDIVDMDGQEYGLLLPVDDEEDEALEDNEEEKEVVLMRLNRVMNEYVFETIDSDEEFEKVAKYIESFDEPEE